MMRNPGIPSHFVIDYSVIRDLTKGKYGRLKLSSSLVIQKNPQLNSEKEPQENSPVLAKTIEFFLDQNPNSSAGDCICVCMNLLFYSNHVLGAPISIFNFLFGIKKAVYRLLKLNSNNSRDKLSSLRNPIPIRNLSCTFFLVP